MKYTLILSIQFSSVGFVYQFLTTAIYTFLGIVEGIRLYLGYLGNLQEKVLLYHNLLFVISFNL